MSLLPNWYSKIVEERMKPNPIYDSMIKTPWKKRIENYDRRWYQFWKPKIIDNPWYDPRYKPGGVKFKIPRLTR